MKNKIVASIFIVFTIIFCQSCEKAFLQTRKSVYYIHVLKNWGTVDAAYTTYIETTLKRINSKTNVEAIIFEIDTPGGSIRDAEKIVKMISECSKKTITYISNSAFSAGALLTLAADYSASVPHGKVGAAEPVLIDQRKQAMKKASEKIVSAVRATIRSLAQKRAERLLREADGDAKKRHNMKFVANLPTIAEAMVDSQVVLTKALHGTDLTDKKLLTLTAEEALKTGFIDYVAKNKEELLKKFNLTSFKLVEVTPSVKHVFIAFLLNQWVLMALLSLGMLGLIIEIKTPGWGIPGTFGLLALSLFFYANIVAGNASWEAPVLFILGLVLLGVEIFVIPGFGVVGISGIILVFLSLYSGLGVSFNNFSATRHLVSRASFIIFGSVFTSFVLVYLIAKLLPKTRLFPKIVLTDTELGFKAHDDMSLLIGKKGICVSSLRPSGTAIIEDKRISVVTEASFIEKNKKIKVIAVEGSRIIVKEDN
jgi:membrane-bound serine protease (ClpP class)